MHSETTRKIEKPQKNKGIMIVYRIYHKLSKSTIKIKQCWASD